MSETARELVDRLDQWIAPQLDVRELIERTNAVLAECEAVSRDPLRWQSKSELVAHLLSLLNGEVQP
jgi:chemotaxis regulatin CheY-phosphate phosphatase CheZ